MTSAEFLAVVLPSEGFGLYCAVELTKKKEHVYAAKIDDLIPTIEQWHANNYDVFYSVATFDKKRGAEEAQYLKSFFVDLDGYTSKKAAADALIQFLQSSGLDALGTPWVVDSGGGLHCYWPLKDEVPAAVWKPVAENLKRLCKQEGFNIDMTVTADLARILRVPGTANNKKKYATPRPVRIVQEGDIFDFATFSPLVYEKLEEVPAPPTPKADLPGQRPTAPTRSQVKLMQDSYTVFENFENQCGQIQDYIATATDDGKEPIWRGILSWAKVCTDGAEKAVWL